jgi:hypothetical protein
MMKPWHRLLLSQLVLAGIILNLCAAARRDDFSAQTLPMMIAQTVWYAGLILPLAGGPRFEKIGTWLVGGGAWMMLSAALCRGFDIDSVAACVAILLSVPTLILLAVGGLYGLARIRR